MPRLKYYNTEINQWEYISADGKSAYAYAQDGGYTGTEEEFAAKLANSDSSVQSDWNAAEGEPGYVLNRTHWAEQALVEPIFDGNLTGREKILADVDVGAYAVRITQQSVTVGELLGAVMVMNMGGEEQSVPLTAEMAMDSNLVLGVPGAVVLQGSDPVVLSLEEDSIIQGAHFAAGTWVMCIPGAFYVKSLSCLQSGKAEVIHKLDNKFIDAEWMATKTVGKGTAILEETECTNTHGGSIGGAANLQTNKVLEEEKTYIVTWDGVEYLCHSAFRNTLVFLGNLGLGGMVEGELDTGEPFIIAEVGEGSSRVVIQWMTGDSHICSIHEATEACNPLPEIYLPDSVIRRDEYIADKKVLMDSRTHWTDEDGTVHKLDNKYIDAEWMAVREEQSKDTEILNINITDAPGGTKAYNLTKRHNVSELSLEVGMIVKVLFDNVEYTCTVNAGAYSSVNLWLGDGSIRPNTSGVSESTGEPFFLIHRGGNYNDYLVYGMPEGNHTMKLTGSILSVIPVTIPEEFLPEGIRSSAFYVTVSGSKAGGYTADKTFAEILAAYKSNYSVYMIVNTDEVLEESLNAAPMILQLNTVDESSILQFATFDFGREVSFTIDSDEVIDGTFNIFVSEEGSIKNPYKLTINGIAYDGSSAISIDTSALYVNITLYPDGTSSMSHTVADIEEAYQNNRTIICNYGSTATVLNHFLPLIRRTSATQWIFGGDLIVDGCLIRVHINKDVVTETLVEMATASSIPSDSHINELISAQISAITDAEEVSF